MHCGLPRDPLGDVCGEFDTFKADCEAVVCAAVNGGATVAAEDTVCEERERQRDVLAFFKDLDEEEGEEEEERNNYFATLA